MNNYVRFLEMSDDEFEEYQCKNYKSPNKIILSIIICIFISTVISELFVTYVIKSSEQICTIFTLIITALYVAHIGSKDEKIELYKYMRKKLAEKDYEYEKIIRYKTEQIECLESILEETSNGEELDHNINMSDEAKERIRNNILKILEEFAKTINNQTQEDIND